MERVNVDLINGYMRLYKLSVSEFAKKCNISFSALYKILNKEKNSFKRTINKIAKAMNISPLLLCMTSEDIYMFLTYGSKQNKYI